MNSLIESMLKITPIEPKRYTVNTEACQKRFKESSYETTFCGSPVIRAYCPKADVTFVVSKEELNMLNTDNAIDWYVDGVCEKNCKFYREEQKKSKFQVVK